MTSLKWEFSAVAINDKTKNTSALPVFLIEASRLACHKIDSCVVNGMYGILSMGTLSCPSRNQNVPQLHGR